VANKHDQWRTATKQANTILVVGMLAMIFFAGAALAALGNPVGFLWYLPPSKVKNRRWSCSPKSAEGSRSSRGLRLRSVKRSRLQGWG
jgi:hypothetical protein